MRRSGKWWWPSRTGVEPSLIARSGWLDDPARVATDGRIPNPLGKRVWIEEADDLCLYRPAHRGIKPGGDLLGGVSALQETDLTGPLSIFKLLP